MFEALLRLFSRASPSERIAALLQKLSRVEADLHSLEQEVRVSPAFAGAGLEPFFLEVQALFDNIQGGLERLAPVIAQAGKAPEVEASLKSFAGTTDRMASRIEEMRARVRQHRQRG
jgi:hypothetical protein